MISTPPITAEEILDNYAALYFQLLLRPTLKAQQLKDEVRAGALKQINNLLLQERISELESLDKTTDYNERPVIDGVVYSVIQERIADLKSQLNKGDI